jgi:hypothetical protein
VISIVAARVELIYVFELYGQLVYHEQCQELCGREYSMTNATTKGHGNFPGRGGFDHGAPVGRGCGRARTTTPMVKNTLNASCAVGRDILSRRVTRGLTIILPVKTRVHPWLSLLMKLT